MSAPRPYNLIAELTYRCPLRCAYCSNPTNHADIRDGLDALGWARVFREASALGCVHVGLTGGEPSVRPDLPEIVESAAAAGLFTHLVTAGLPLDAAGLTTLKQRGLRSVQLSVQAAEADMSDRIAGTRSFAAKRALAAAARELELPLVLNVVLHRENLGQVEALIALASEIGAHRLELANTQYHGWALVNRAGLMPERQAVEAAAAQVRTARAHYPDLEIQFVLPDYFSERPKPCMGGWGAKMMVVAPDGRVYPCHGASQLRALEFWSAAERSLRDCWQDAPGMNAYRGEAWMQEPCRSCPERAKDFGGCRCQAFALTGDASATDPACGLSPSHAVVDAARGDEQTEWRYRGGTRPERTKL